MELSKVYLGCLYETGSVKKAPQSENTDFELIICFGLRGKVLVAQDLQGWLL